jgi:redox-sensing transcriptional repressor
LQVQDLDHLERFAQTQRVDLAILAVPANAASAVASRLQSSGVAGILNFAPVVIPSNSAITVQPVDLALELQRLAFSVVQRHGIAHLGEIAIRTEDSLEEVD